MSRRADAREVVVVPEWYGLEPSDAYEVIADVLHGSGGRTTEDGTFRLDECQDCGQAMIAKTGDVKVWHWAHRTENPGCASAGESEWHLGWKALGPPDSQERTVGNRRADVLAPGGFTVEAQKSALTAAEVAQREADWKGRLVWIFDAIDACEEGRLTLWRNEERQGAAANAHLSDAGTSEQGPFIDPGGFAPADPPRRRSRGPCPGSASAKAPARPRRSACGAKAGRSGGRACGAPAPMRKPDPGACPRGHPVKCLAVALAKADRLRPAF